MSAARDAAVLCGRNLITYRRVPQLLLYSTIQPVVLLLLFRYAWGGVVSDRFLPYPYVDFLVPGIFVQTVVFGAMNTATGLAVDLRAGLLERCRSLPMSRSAVLAGRTFADLARNVFVAVLMAVVGIAVGFRIHTNIGLFVAGMLLVLLFGFVCSWIFAIVGLAVGDAETAQAASLPVMALLVFASSAFVPVDAMPDGLRVFAENQPVSVVTEAVRALMLGGPTASHVWAALAWCAGILVVAVPFAVRQYVRAV
ncbi:ABC transporter permease [Actinomadura sp. 3N508]|uniref:ABC transporter permease n=1 Tax=Actinomadura sp. 3N508 TaxID=3375153 RepID=UPI0037A0B9F8